MHKITFFIKPCPAARVRVTGRGHRYYPAPYQAFKTELASQAAGMEISPVTYPCSIHVAVFDVRPKSTKLMFPKPDIDNYAKGVLDGLNGTVIEDDWLVTDLSVSKRWTDGPARIEVTITKTEEFDGKHHR